MTFHLPIRFAQDPLDAAATVSPNDRWKVAFAKDGFAILPEIAGGADLDRLRVEADRILHDSDDRGGARNALRKSSLLREFRDALEIAASLLGPETRVTKLTVFDKSLLANWKVPMHQDLTISVSERRRFEGFRPLVAERRNSACPAAE